MTFNGHFRKMLIGAGCAGAFMGGFLTGRTPAKAEPVAVADPSLAQRLQSIDLTLQEMRRDLSVQQTDVRVIKCYLHLENICPPDLRP